MIAIDCENPEVCLLGADQCEACERETLEQDLDQSENDSEE